MGVGTRLSRAVRPAIVRRHWPKAKCARAEGVGLPEAKPSREAVAINDARRPVACRVKISDRASGRILLERSFEIAANGKFDLGGLDVKGQGALAIDYEIGGMKFKNHYLYGHPPFAFEEVKWLLD